LEHAGLDRGANRHHFIGVDAFPRLLTEEVRDGLLDLRHTRHAANENNLVDFLRLDLRIFHCVPARLFRAVDQIVNKFLQLGAPELDLKMLRAILIGRDEGQADGGFERRGKLDLGLLCRFPKPL
jgi:hypothetical protein